MPKISVLIPVYNVEKYLERCLESVLNQTFQDFEIILVNDCSPDNSYKILEAYQKKDKRIKIYSHATNQGLAKARNTGLSHAKGEYIYFLDSDDWIALDFLQKMYDKLIQIKEPAICCTNVLYAYPDGSEKPFLKREKNGFVNPSKACLMAWAWLLEKKFLDKFEIIFPEGMIYEDIWFFHTIIKTLDKVYILNDTTYYHFENETSVMGKADGRIIKDFDSIKVNELIYEHYKAKGLLDKMAIPFFYLPKYCFSRHTDKKLYFEKLKTFYSKIKDDVLNNRNLYSEIEIDFLDEVLNSNGCENHQKLNSSIIGALRNNVRKDLCSN